SCSKQQETTLKVKAPAPGLPTGSQSHSDPASRAAPPHPPAPARNNPHRDKFSRSATIPPRMRRLTIHCDDLPDGTVATNAVDPAGLRSNGWEVAAATSARRCCCPERLSRAICGRGRGWLVRGRGGLSLARAAAAAAAGPP